MILYTVRDLPGFKKYEVGKSMFTKTISGVEIWDVVTTLDVPEELVEKAMKLGATKKKP